MSKVVGKGLWRERVRPSRLAIREAVKHAFKKKERVRYLTPEQFLKLSLSEAVSQVIEDLKKMRRARITIDMNDWWKVTEGSDTPCCVCLGGAALCSFAPDEVNGFTIGQYGRKVLGIKAREANRIAGTFDKLRVGNLESSFKHWYGKTLPDKLDDLRYYCHAYAFWDTIEDAGYVVLIDYLKTVSRELRKAGY